jgi:heme oxygenase
MDLEKLRSATRSEHEAVESAMPLMQSGLTLEQYAEVLRRLYLLISSWEEWAQSSAPLDLTGMVRSRQRRALLEYDLSLIGMAQPRKAGNFPQRKIPGLCVEDRRFRASFLGTMYVIEGSTLGGRYIARRVEHALRLKAGEGCAYFRGYGDRTEEMWQAFRAVLAGVPEDQSAHVIAASKAMFRVFGDGMRG